jgi:hypothetical protein
MAHKVLSRAKFPVENFADTTAVDSTAKAAPVVAPDTLKRKEPSAEKERPMEQRRREKARPATRDTTVRDRTKPKKKPIDRCPNLLPGLSPLQLQRMLPCSAAPEIARWCAWASSECSDDETSDPSAQAIQRVLDAGDRLELLFNVVDVGRKRWPKRRRLDVLGPLGGFSCQMTTFHDRRPCRRGLGVAPMPITTRSRRGKSSVPSGRNGGRPDDTLDCRLQDTRRNAANRRDLRSDTAWPCRTENLACGPPDAERSPDGRALRFALRSLHGRTYGCGIGFARDAPWPLPGESGR